MSKEMPQGLRSLITTVTGLKPTEKLIIITDDVNQDMGLYAYNFLKDDYNATLMLMPVRSGHGAEPTELVANAMLECDVCFSFTTMSLYHSTARNYASKNGKMRFVSLTDQTVALLSENGMVADFIEVEKVVRRVEPHYQGKVFHLTAPGGTDITCSVEGRAPVPETCRAITPGSTSGAPNAEIALGPVEGTGNGILVIDGSIPHPELNLIKEPITCKVVDGMITEITGGEEAETLKRVLASFDDPTVYTFAELGLGLNDKCFLCGHMAQDEGSFGNIHIGIGKNTGFGGNVDSPLHLDMVIKNITAEIDGRIIMKDGVLKV